MFNSSFAMSANVCYVYVRGEYVNERYSPQKAIDEAYEAGFIGKNACQSGWDLIFTCTMEQGHTYAVETALLKTLKVKKECQDLNLHFQLIAGLDVWQ